jgi:hypothetical protein
VRAVEVAALVSRARDAGSPREGNQSALAVFD